ncbi:MAG TPA: tetratricopeptide repeat-containing protein [Solirubrobacterales bacterium]|nr:tetratricopeptide repeat-containing protein [Solirubrobacterales bacterium]
MIVAYAGRRPSEDGFPEAREAEARERIARLLAGLQPRLIVGSAAAGADLLMLEGGLVVGAEGRVVLAGIPDTFRESSVADKGEAWEQRYSQVLNHEDVTVESTKRIDGDEKASYKAVTDRIWELAHEELEDGEGLLVVIVSHPREGSTDHTEELAGLQELDGGVVLRIDPLLVDEDMPRAFVAMPFGTRPWPDRNLNRYKADLTYHRILLPALIGKGYNPMRADTQALLEVIDSKMLAAIAHSDLLIADLATENPNVMWELGVRHAWCRSGTILIAPEGVRPPFDVARVPVHSYRRDATKIKDVDCIEAIQTIQQVLGDVERGDVDSPAFIHLQGLEPVRLGVEADDTEEDAAGDFLDSITLAADLRRDEDLRRLAAEIESTADLRNSSRAPLLEQVGLALIDLNRHGDGASVLRPLAEADGDFSSLVLQEQFAHALIRDRSTEGREERLAEAELRLQRLIERQEVGGETHGLLGSAAKARVEIAVADGGDPLAHLELALRAYEAGLRADPGDYYPGINAVALLRLRGQLLRPNEEDLDRARELLPVVRFGVLRAGEQAIDEDPWALLTLGECALHEFLLGGDEKIEAKMKAWYERAAGRIAPNQHRSARGQLELFLHAGDPAEVIEPRLALFT